jgi:nickel transport system permease protein
MTGLAAFLRRKTALVALAMCLLVTGMAVFAPALSPADPNATDLAIRLENPSLRHPLGTDHLGRDILSRLMYGARVSLGSAAIIVALVLGLSLMVGLLAGYAGGPVDAALMRLCDVFLTFPTFILAMFMVGILGMGLTNVILAIVLTHWAWYARIIRGLTLSLKNREYVLAARAAGTPPVKLAARHILPGVFVQLIVLATLDIGHMMLHVSGLSFLGLGVRPPTPEWGVMINDARQYIATRPLLILYPGLMIFLTVMSFNLLGDALRDALDPALAGQPAESEAEAAPSSLRPEVGP